MRQLSFAFLRDRQHIAQTVSGSSFGPVAMRRIDPMQNMARFYSMEVDRDLFGKVVLVRRWGRMGTAGRIRLDEYAGEGAALAALQALQTAKRRRGYQPVGRT